MRLLIITNNPERASFRQRVGAYLDILAGRGIETEVAVLPKGFLARGELFRRAERFDGVFLHKKKLNRWDALRLRRHSKRIIYSFDDAIMYSDRRPESYSRAHFVPFRRTVRLADMVIAGSAYLADRARPYNANVHALPLGLNVRDYGLDPLPAPDGKIRLVWIGSEATLAYLEAIKPALEQIIARYENALLRVVSDAFPAWRGFPMEPVVWSSQSRRTALATSDIGLAPLPDNPFTRGKCSFKVLEYSASGLPVVASPVGTNAEYVRNGITGFLVGSTNDWVDKIGQLIDNPSLRQSMGRAGIERAREFDVGVVGEELCRLISTCLQQQ